MDRVIQITGTNLNRGNAQYADRICDTSIEPDHEEQRGDQNDR